MSITINGTTGISGVDGSSTTPAFQGNDTNTGLFYGTDIVGISTGGSERVRVDANGNVGIGTTNPSPKITVARTATTSVTNASYYLGLGGTENLVDSKRLIGMGYSNGSSEEYPTAMGYVETSNASYTNGAIAFYTRSVTTNTAPSERMRIDSSGNVHIAKTATSFGATGISLRTGVSNDSHFVSDSSNVIAINRLTNDGNLMEFYQATTLEGTISVSGTTVSYNGGHLSRWSQWQNETGKPNVYRGTVLESTNDMCEWEKDGEPLPNEQATKTIVSTTVASKTVAGVFDRYDEDDETNPYDFYVAQSGDFVIRIAQGVVVQNGDLLESAGDGTAKPQADDICRSSTIAKVTSNYVSATYEDGSYCVPCILMIG